MANEAIEKFILSAKGAGIPKDQLENFLISGYVPLPWQLRFHALAREADKPDGPTEIGVGGSRGPGKSHCVFAQVSLDDCQRVPGLKGLFLRQTGKAARESFEDLVLRVLAGKITYNYNRSNNVLSFKNNSRVILGGFEDEKDIEKYIGIEYDFVAIEELNQLTKDKIDKLLGSMRTSKLNWRPRMYSSFNPGGIGHSYVKEEFVLPFREKRETKTRFVPASYRDNPYLNKEYIDYLLGLVGDLGKMWRDGEWDLFAGMYFDEWNTEKHTCYPFPIPESWKKFRSYDHGRENPASCKWYALDFDGRVWVYREYYERGKNIDQIAEEIKRLSGNEQYEWSTADPSIFANTGMIDRSGGQTIAETFARNGISFIPASNRRVDGWNLMHQYLAWNKDITPKMIFFNTCYNAIRTIPALIHDEHKPEDLDSRGEDHCLSRETKVDTLLGKKKVKDLIGKEVYVNSLSGFVKCRSVRTVGKRDVFRLLLENGLIIKATEEHKFFTTNGWKRLKEIDIGKDKLMQSKVCIKSYLILFRNLMEKDIIFVADFSKGMVRDFIGLFGNFTKERYQKDFISTIKTRIEETTIYPISECSQDLNICRGMGCNQKIKNDQEKISKLQGLSPTNGIVQRKAGNGTKNKESIFGVIGKLLQRIVRYAEKNMRLSFLQYQNTAIKIVRLQRYGEEDVYDLTVPFVENFTIENGIVVHNSADDTRYFLTKLHEQKTPPPMTETEKKLREMYGDQSLDFNSFYANQQK